MSRKNVIIIGASSGIGKELARLFSNNDFTVGITARRVELLYQFVAELPGKSFVKYMDVVQTEEAREILEELIKEMGGADIIVVNAGIGFSDTELAWKKDKDTIDVNVVGFTAMANAAMDYFLRQKTGHLVGISSIAGLRGSVVAPAYGASKAYESNYLESMRIQAYKKNVPVFVTDIRPGFVDTALIVSNKMFWTATPQKAACEIFEAIKKKKKRAYITKRWSLAAFIFKLIPARLMARWY